MKVCYFSKVLVHACIIFFPRPSQFSYFYVLFFMVIKLDQKLAKEFGLFERTGEEDTEVDACRYYNDENNLEKGMDRVV